MLQKCLTYQTMLKVILLAELPDVRLQSQQVYALITLADSYL